MCETDQSSASADDIKRACPAFRKAVIVVRKRVGVALWKLRAKGVVEEVPQAGDDKGWRMA